MSGEEDFFSVARTIPLVAVLVRWMMMLVRKGRTFDTEGGDTLVDSIQSIFYIRQYIPRLDAMSALPICTSLPLLMVS